MHRHTMLGTLHPFLILLCRWESFKGGNRSLCYVMIIEQDNEFVSSHNPTICCIKECNKVIHIHDYKILR